MRTIKIRNGHGDWVETTHHPPYDAQPLVVTNEVSPDGNKSRPYTVTHRQTGCAVSWRATLEEAQKDRTLLLASDFDWTQPLPLPGEPDPNGLIHMAKAACAAFLPKGWHR